MKEEESKTAFLMSRLSIHPKSVQANMSPEGSEGSVLETSRSFTHEESVLSHFLQNQLEVGVTARVHA